jgi:hypothetical protein
MDFEQLKQQVKEIGEVAESVPEAFREKCFELLLQALLGEIDPPANRARRTIPEKEKVELAPEDGAGKADEPQVDITMSSLHTKAKKFLESNGLTISQVNDLFYREDDDILPLYEDLGTTQLADSQIRIALLQAFRHALETGDFVFNGEAVREEAKTRKAYDGSNFTANFNNSATFFDGFDKYNSKAADIKLSPAGKKRLAEVVATLTR